MIELSPELIQLEQILAPTLKSNVRSIAITASQSKEGTSTLALGLAKRIAIGGKSTLLVDMNLPEPTISHYFNTDFQNHSSFKEAIEQNIVASNVENLSIMPAPNNSQYILDLRDREKLTQCMQKWLAKFEYVIIDCSPLIPVDHKIIPAENICSICQGCIMMVLAGRTTETKVLEAIHKLRNVDANIIGTILNDQFNPRLDDELSKATHKLDRIFPKWMESLRQKINNSGILTLDI